VSEQETFKILFENPSAR